MGESINFDEEIKKIKEQAQNGIQTQENNSPIVKLKNNEIVKENPTQQTNVMEVVKQEEQELLKTKEFKEVSKKFGEERIKSDLAEEASRIRKRNQDTAEREFETETRELRLKHLKEQMKKQHKYDMETLEEDAKHSQTLDKRKKLVEKYGYLYNKDNLIDCVDGKGNVYKTPQDFSYSWFVNKFRQIGRNISKLDKPFLQTIKWVFIAGAIALGIFILKKFNII